MTNKVAVIYLQKEKFQIYSPALPQVVEFRFVPEVIRDLDVVNSEMLQNLVKVFITNSKLPPSSLILVLADNAYFTKDFSMPDPKQQQPKPNDSPDVVKELLQKQADQFVEHVPFDNVVSKSFPLKNGIKVCATNKDFYEGIAVAFEQQGFTISTVLPGLVFGNGLSARPVMDPAMANLIEQKAASLKQYDLLSQAVFQPIVEKTPEEEDEVETEKAETKKTDKKRLITLTGVFATLLVLLVIVYVQSQTPPSPPQQPIQADNTQSDLPSVVNNEPVATTAPAAASPSELQTQGLQVQIVSNEATATVAQELRTAFGTYNFAGVTTQTQSTVSSAVTQVNFSGNTPNAVRNAVLEEVRKHRSSISVQERQEGSFDISIILGN